MNYNKGNEVDAILSQEIEVNIASNPGSFNTTSDPIAMKSYVDMNVSRLTNKVANLGAVTSNYLKTSRDVTGEIFKVDMPTTSQGSNFWIDDGEYLNVATPPQI